MQRPPDASAAGVRGNHSPPVANDKWVASLRRRDPDIQPALPAIGALRGRWVGGWVGTNHAERAQLV